jgi:hypothetical protein
MPWNKTPVSRLRRLFLDGFSALDIAEPLVSFDSGAEAQAVRDFMAEKDYDLVGIRQDGLVSGYVRREDLSSGTCRDHLHPFIPDDDLVPSTANLTEVVKSLAINRQCFVTILDSVGAIITLNDLEKLPMRMFLFGMVTVGEMMMTEIIRHRHGDGSWKELVSPQRLAKAEQLHEERMRIGQKVDLIDCLQYCDKGWIITNDEEFCRELGQESKNQARKTIKEFETLRNNLAHTQEIIPTGWQRIVIACSRLDQNLGKIADRLNGLEKKNVISDNSDYPN